MPSALSPPDGGFFICEACNVTTETIEKTDEQIKEQKAMETREAAEGFAAGFKAVRKEETPGVPDKPADATVSTSEPSDAERDAKVAADAKAAAEAKAQAEVDAKAKAEADRGKFLDALPIRLRNLEGHIGGLNNKLDTALATAKAAAEKKGGDAPSDTQVQAALSNPDAWKKLKEDFPDWAGPVEAEFAAIRGEIAKAKTTPVDVDSLKKEVAGTVGATLSKGLEQAEERAFVRLKHPTWRNTVKTPEFKTWLDGQPDDVKVLSSSDAGDDAVKLLDTYSEHQKKVSQSEEARLKREKRLAGALTPTGTSGDAPTGISDEAAFERGYRRAKGK